MPFFILYSAHTAHTVNIIKKSFKHFVVNVYFADTTRCQTCNATCVGLIIVNVMLSIGFVILTYFYVQKLRIQSRDNSEKQIYMDTILENCNVNIASPGDMKIIIFSHLSDFI